MNSPKRARRRALRAPPVFAPGLDSIAPCATRRRRAPGTGPNFSRKIAHSMLQCVQAMSAGSTTRSSAGLPGRSDRNVRRFSRSVAFRTRAGEEAEAAREADWVESPARVLGLALPSSSHRADSKCARRGEVGARLTRESQSVVPRATKCTQRLA